MPTQPGRRLDPTPGDPRPDPTAPQVGPVRRTVVALVSVDRARPGASPPSRRTDRRNVIQDRLERVGVVDVGGGHRGRQRQPATVADQLEPASRLATIDWICAHLVPHAWPARSGCPRWPATSPAGRARPAGRAPRGGAGRTPRHLPTRQGGASTSPVTRSRAPGRATGATGWRYRP